MLDLALVIRAARIIPLITIRDVKHSVPLASALVDAGLNVLEVTLRTEGALEAIRAISAEVKDAIVGAGTVLNRQQVSSAVKAGAKFTVSPGLVEEVCGASRDHGVPILPGVATASEVMRGLSIGLETFKFFPAEQIGGIAALTALRGPFPQVRFCPTGGITPGNLQAYLSLPNVIAVGGSWMVPSDLNEADAIARTTALACAARDLV
jgi:2-dehydro-3-deoxyphosphogluconate aldolase / (4S)-4-hydroxy-2-oxoglutarate aldolase